MNQQVKVATKRGLKRALRYKLSQVGTVLFTGVAMYGLFADNHKLMVFGMLLLAMKLITRLNRISFCVETLAERSNQF